MALVLEGITADVVYVLALAGEDPGGPVWTKGGKSALSRTGCTDARLYRAAAAWARAGSAWLGRPASGSGRSRLLVATRATLPAWTSSA